MVASGMFTCAWIIDKRTKEQIWQVVSPDGSQLASKTKVRLAWIQRGKVVNDQTFHSYAIFAREPRDSVLTSRRLEKRAGSDGKPRNPGNFRGKHLLYLQTHTMVSSVVTIVGFVLQFSGLRMMSWSAALAQFVGTAVMTGVRLFLRRGMADRPDARYLLEGYEIDWLALGLTLNGANLWSENGADDKNLGNPTEYNPTWIIDTGGKPNGYMSSPEERDAEINQTNSAYRALRTRERLGRLSKWRGASSELSYSVVVAMESVMDTLFTDTNTREFVWALDAKITSGKDSDRSGNPEKIYFTILRNGSNMWKANFVEIEAALSLWLYSNAESSRNSPVQNEDEDGWFRTGDFASKKKVMRLLGNDTETELRDILWYSGRGSTDRLKSVKLEIGDPDSTSSYIDISKCCVVGFSHREPLDGNPSSTTAPVAVSDAIYLTTAKYRLIGGLDEILESKPNGQHSLAFISDVSLEKVLAQELFSFFIWAVAKALDGPIKSPAIASANHTLDQDKITEAFEGYHNIDIHGFYYRFKERFYPMFWQGFRLENSLLQKIVDDIQQAKLASAEEAWMLIIPPLGAERKLPEPSAVIDLVRKYTATYNLTEKNWLTMGSLYIGLFRIFKLYGTENPLCHKASAILIDFFRVVSSTFQLWREEKRGGIWMGIQERSTLKRVLLKELQSLGGNVVFYLAKVYQLQEQSGPWAVRPVRDSFGVIELERVRRTETLPVYGERTQFLHFEGRELVRKGWDAAVIYGVEDWPEFFKVSLELANQKAKPGSVDIFGWSKDHYMVFIYDNAGIYHWEFSASKAYHDLNGWTPMHYLACRNKVPLPRKFKDFVDIQIQGRDGMRLLHCAAKNGHIEFARHLVQRGADVESKDHRQRTALHWACSHGGYDMVTLLLNEGQAYIGFRDEYLRFPLHNAALAGDAKIVKLLLAQIAKQVASEDLDQRTPLDLAIAGCFEDAVNLLMEASASYHSKSKGMVCRALVSAARSGMATPVNRLLGKGFDVNLPVLKNTLTEETLLHIASGHGSDDVIKVLIKQGANINARTTVGKTALHFASSKHVGGSTIRLLLQYGASVNARDLKEMTPLHIAADFNNYIAVSTLLKKGGEIEGRDKSGRTPLHLSVCRMARKDPHARALRVLLNRGADTEARNGSGCTPLHEGAQSFGAANLILVLLDVGDANINARDNMDCTPLHHSSAFSGDPRNIKALLDRGAEIEARDFQGCTPLHYASTNGTFGCVCMLLDNSAEIEALDNDNQTPLRYWANGSIDLLPKLQLLLNRGANINAISANGKTVLHIMANIGRKRNSACVSELLRQGVDTKIEDSEGNTALSLVKDEAIRALFQPGASYPDPPEFEALDPTNPELLHSASSSLRSSGSRLVSSPSSFSSSFSSSSSSRDEVECLASEESSSSSD